MRLHPTLLICATTAALLTACGTDDPATTATPAPPPASGEQSAATPTVVTPAPTPIRSTPQAQSPPAVPTDAPVASDPLQGNGRCLDLDSAPVAEALAGMGDGTFAWRAETATDAPIGQCPSLRWLVAVGGNSAAAPEHILFFADGRYLGTGTSEPYAFTSVAGSTDTTVTASYRWLTGDEPFCCPQGGPAEITYAWDGTQIVMQQPLPQEMLDSYGGGN
ncbi:LppP/LprE family lipoprotein [Rhodococcus chondri]|uniref:LppP/LprE family lipoprotein n=1 Tax=Rhodococcus chondri TaxID=3065941 RepID=A0ABU7JXF1_9NOCA|nr:LppP/LprE family lipoprotein [Rhodococcus sp. CC-R104]MEE2034701.1 LppP/LprE family lipoprotein [Rhodococcus sp. CC-R104]